MANKKNKTNWLVIQEEYRTGQFSNVALAKKHGLSETMIRKKAKQEGWIKDLAEAVRNKVRDKLVCNEVRNPTARDDEEIVEEAADRGVQVVLSHRKDISKLRTHEQRLLEELEREPKRLYITQYQGNIVEKEVGLTVDAKAGALRDLAKVQEMRIGLERQAFNLDERKEQGEGNKVFVYEHFLAALIIERKKIAEQKALPGAISEEKI